ncbi:Hypothetical protein PACV_300 [Pacmanvirus A23]|uniref:Hypothetical protein n=1 Tax=Pacmanvirus A23 TaxID=1932881 RepID=UPI000A092E31|nr:Hypothetical protein B9W72_gp296 [Pacmanvirus A23]SIP86013.1 Hypothetical protein PACV_300 [Pacmanvirus A23]
MEGTKICNVCNISKVISEFRPRGRVCKNCTNIKQRKWRAVNKDKTRKYREKGNVRVKKWKEEHKDKQREYYKKFIEKKEKELENQAARILATLKN